MKGVAKVSAGMHMYLNNSVSTFWFKTSKQQVSTPGDLHSALQQEKRTLNTPVCPLAEPQPVLVGIVQLASFGYHVW